MSDVSTLQCRYDAMKVCQGRDWAVLGDRAVCRNFSGGGGKFGVQTKEGGGQKLMWGATQYTCWGGGGYSPG